MRWSARPAHVVAARILRERFAEDGGPDDGRDRPRAFPLAPFQDAGVRRLRRILDRRGGAVLADSVGLGKTYMALALVEEALERGRPAVVVVPAALRGLWRSPLDRLRRRAGARVALVSHTQLSRGGYAAPPWWRDGLVVVDEAHRFRNPLTRRYAALAGLCAGARVLLLTATPVNNSVADLYHLLRLFSRDDGFLDLGVPSLADLFRVGRASRPAVTDPDAARRLTADVMVRRTRADVGAPSAGVRFPRREPPRLVRFDDPRIPGLVAAIDALELAALPAPTAALVRLGLLKRLDSGTAALDRSLARQAGFARSFLAAAEAGLLLRPGRDAGGRGGDGDPLQLVLLDLVAERWPAGVDRAAAIVGARRDLVRLETMRRELTGDDPKLAALLELVGRLGHEKVLVFTEFRDTAETLWRALLRRSRVGRIDGSGAFLGRQPAGRRAVVERFAPGANGAREPAARERVDALVATDVLAEGLNLQDARHLVSYDLPWNPVRLMQRIGRVDRLGSLHVTVVPHLFLPTQGLDAVIGLTRRLGRKLGQIAGTVGADEAMDLLARIDRGEAEAARAIIAVETRGATPLERLRARWAGAAGDGPDGCGGAMVARAPAGAPGLALVRFRGRLRLLRFGPRGRLRDAREEDYLALDRLACAGEADGNGAGREAVHVAEVRRLMARIGAWADAMHGLAAAPAPLGRGDPGRALARRVRVALATAGIGATAEQVERAGRLLEAVQRPLDGRSARRARELRELTSDDLALDSLLDRAEAALDVASSRPAGAPRGPDRDAAPRLIAALLVG